MRGMRKLLSCGVSVCLMALSACVGSTRAGVPEGAETMSVGDLYENAKSFDGKKVIVQGYGLFTENPFDKFGGHYTIFPGLPGDTATGEIKCRDLDSRLLHANPSYKDRNAEAALSSRERPDGGLDINPKRVFVEGVFRAETKHVEFGLAVEKHESYLDEVRFLSILSERCDMR